MHCFLSICCTSDFVRYESEPIRRRFNRKQSNQNRKIGLAVVCLFFRFAKIPILWSIPGQYTHVRKPLNPMAPSICNSARPHVLDTQALPLHPWPQVATELGNLEEGHKRIENANMDKLQREFNKATGDALH